MIDFMFTQNRCTLQENRNYNNQKSRRLINRNTQDYAVLSNGIKEKLPHCTASGIQLTVSILY